MFVEFGRIGWGMRRLLLVVVVAAGCSGRPASAPSSVTFSGAIRTAAGQQVGNVIVHFHPLAPGFACATEVAGDGTFTTAAPPGDYAWSIRRADQAVPAAADAAIGAVPERYRETDLARTVRIAEGAQVAIVID